MPDPGGQHAVDGRPGDGPGRDTLKTAQAGKDDTRTVQVAGSKLGSIDQTGVYTPVLAGNGLTGSPYPNGTFTLTRLDGEWRISKLPDGLLISRSQFETASPTQFQQRSLYFFDLAEEALVPDPRYTQLTEPSALATWLLRGLAAGPREAIATALARELPDTDTTRLSAVVPENDTKPVQLVIPGAGETERGQRAALAAELAKTMEQVPAIGAGRALRILDGDAPVSIPGIGTDFTAEDFPDLIADAINSLDVPELYYVDNGGGVVSADRQPAARQDRPRVLRPDLGGAEADVHVERPARRGSAPVQGRRDGGRRYRHRLVRPGRRGERRPVPTGLGAERAASSGSAPDRACTG